MNKFNTMNQYYEVLGLKNNASEGDIKKAYRKMSKKFHPDVNKDADAVEKMSKVNEAYEVLTGKRKEPEKQRSNPFNSNPFSGFGGFGDQFTKRSVRPMQLVVEITLEEVFSGVDKEVSFNQSTSCDGCSGNGGKEPMVCPHCRGKGYVTNTTITFICNTCNGEGNVYTKQCGGCHGSGNKKSIKNVTINIPKGMTGGNIIMRGIGNQVKGSNPGDVIFKIVLKKHPLFEIDGLNITKREKVNIIDLMLGTELEIVTLDGKVKIKVDKLCPPNKVFRLIAKGLMDARSGVRGNLFITVDGVMPKTLSNEQEEMLRNLKYNTSMG